MSWTKFKLVIKSIGIFLSIMVLSFEFFSFILSKNNLLLVSNTPNLYQPSGMNIGSVGKNWLTEQDTWGAWHQKNATAHHYKNCFSARYNSNSIGARDDEFSLVKVNKNFLLLGDSFAEGFGINFEDTAQRLIEKKTGHQVLNFGAAGGVGPLQYWLLYENLAKRYPHDGLIIFLLPANDFTDNDYNYWVQNRSNLLNKDGQERYRPYYMPINKSEYDYFIPVNAVKRNRWAYEDSRLEIFKDFFIANFWSANVFRTIRVLWDRSGLVTTSYSGYFDPSEEQQKAVVYFINKIISSTTAKSVLIVSIPTEEDFIRIDNGSIRDNIFWWKSLKNLHTSNPKVKFVDLADHRPISVKDLFFSCDAHWSPVGNQWAADIVSNYLQ